MIYISFGMKKSGSTLAYELTRALLQAMGHPNERLSNRVIEAIHSVNFVRRNFDRETLRRLEEEVSPGGIIVLKTHAPPTDIFRELAAEGRLLGHAIFRDPRDAILSLLDAGWQARQQGRSAFSEIDGWVRATKGYEKDLQTFEQWLDVPGIMATHFEEVAFRSESFLRRVAEQIGAKDLAGLNLPAIVDGVKANAFTQYNRGVPRRHRDELTINETLHLTRRFGRQIELYMQADLDPLDIALIETARTINDSGKALDPAAGRFPSLDTDLPARWTPGSTQPSVKQMPRHHWLRSLLITACSFIPFWKGGVRQSQPQGGRDHVGK